MQKHEYFITLEYIPCGGFQFYYSNKYRSIILNAFIHILNICWVVNTHLSLSHSRSQCVSFYLFIWFGCAQKSIYCIKYYWFGYFNAVMQSSTSILLIYKPQYLSDWWNPIVQQNESFGRISMMQAGYSIESKTYNLLGFRKCIE